MAQPTAYEQYFLELVNRARANPGAEASRLGIDLNQGLSAGTLSNTAKQPLAMNPLLSDSFKEIGIGIGFGEYKGSNGADATQNFARSGGSTFLTGVAFDDKDGDRFYDPGEGLGKLSVSAKSSAGATYQTTTGDGGGYQTALPAG